MTVRDINECIEETDNCSQKCNNHFGGYTCSCYNGYKLHSDNHTCTDINECSLNNGGCHHLCININGSYVCSCDEGYRLLSNNHDCIGNKLLYWTKMS